MRRTLGWICILALGAFCWSAQSAAPARKKGKASTRKTASTRKAGPKKAAATAAASKSGDAKKTSAAKRAKKSAPSVTWRNRQTAPTLERYKEIQDALAAKGYLKPEDANGSWGPGSADALKKFQQEQNIEATGKVNSLSLIALGLGPKRDAAPVPAPAPKPLETPPAK
jgi:peptidoglycan hydrolase-like protein with peptidoglycan-binding domain